MSPTAREYTEAQLQEAAWEVFDVTGYGTTPVIGHLYLSPLDLTELVPRDEHTDAIVVAVPYQLALTDDERMARCRANVEHAIRDYRANH